MMGSGEVIYEKVQVVAVDWIFSSRIKFVGLEPIFVPYQWRAGPGRFLTFGGHWVCLLASRLSKKNTFLIKIAGKIENVSHCQTTPYLIHWREEK